MTITIAVKTYQYISWRKMPKKNWHLQLPIINLHIHNTSKLACIS